MYFHTQLKNVLQAQKKVVHFSPNSDQNKKN